MFNRPSIRRKSTAMEVTINLVPMLDALVTLITFLLFTMSVVAIVSLSSPMPISNSKVQNEKLKEKPLQLTVRVSDKGLDVSSPFDLVAPKRFGMNAEGKHDLVAFHSHLVAIKTKFPKERDLVLLPQAGISYDTLVSVMDAARMLEAGDPPFFIRNEKTGIDELSRLLFPDTVFGNLLGKD